MIEMRNDVMRRVQLESASKEAVKDGFDYTMNQSMQERLTQLRAKQMRPKRKKPWFTILTVITLIPYLMNGGLKDIQSMIGQAEATNAQQIEQVAALMEEHSPDNKAIVSIQIGDRVIQREVTIDDLRALQMAQ